jgi:ubiquinone/menaquinone biosynthesis C-methylase UbiE
MKLEYHSEEELKHLVKQHWETEPCESRAGRGAATRWEYFSRIDDYRYEKSPFIPAFARFDQYHGKKVLEVGLGSGSDFMQWARNGAVAFGRDLTEASVQLVKERLTLEGLIADVATGDVEALEFPNDFFDLIYSYGVIHHSPDTRKAVSEIYRVLRRGGTAKIMIYHIFGAMNFYQWILFALLKFKPWRSIRDVVYYYNESIGTKVYTKSEAREMFSAFKSANIRTLVDAGDTLDFQLSERYGKVWIIRASQRLFGFLKYLRPYVPSCFGTTMLIEAQK